MHIKKFFLSLIGLSISVPTLAAGHLSVPPASFLEYHVSTVRELSQEVTIDPVVRARLAHHFHISDAAMSNYIRRNLMLTHLKAAGRYQVACVRPNGQEYWVLSHLAAGTLVFASRATGQPILKLACGNPMVSLLPPVTSDNNTANPDMLAPPQILETSAQSQLVASAPPDLLPSDAPVDTVLASNDIIPTGFQNAIAAEPVIKTAGSLQAANFASASNLSGFFPVLLGTGALAALASGHSRASNPVLSNNSPSPVPEASTSLSLGLLLVCGLTFLTLRLKRAAVQAE